MESRASDHGDLASKKFSVRSDFSEPYASARNSSPRHTDVENQVQSRQTVRKTTQAGRPSVRRDPSLAELKIEEEQKAALAQRRNKPIIVKCSRWVAESRAFTVLTTLLTIYALTGQDLKIIIFEKPADIYFDGITIFTLVVFTIEVIVSSIGKDDYFMSFFFILDCISTITLLLDVQSFSEWLNAILFNQDLNEELRSSKTARLGAKAGRVVRVLRLVRILKLYKAIYEARQAKKKREEKGIDEDDDWDDINVDRQLGKRQKESRVGKKLSDLTIRRVIILVLMMMIFLPLLRVNEDEKFSASPAYGRWEVLDAFLAMVREKESGDSSLLVEKTHTYQQALLRFIFYHNWYSGSEVLQPETCAEGDGVICPSWHSSNIFWVGLAGPDVAELEDKTELARIPLNVSQKFQREAVEKDTPYRYGTIPDDVLRKLAAVWEPVPDFEYCEQTKNGDHRRGFSLIAEESDVVKYAVPCPESLRKGLGYEWFPTFYNTFYETEKYRFDFYFDARTVWRKEAELNLYIMGFVCVSLCVSAMAFSSDANKLVLSPVENMISKVEMIRDNPLMAMKMADDEFKVEEMERAQQRRAEENKSIFSLLNKMYNIMCCTGASQVKSEPLETLILEKTIIKLGSLLALGFGEAGSSIIEHNMHGVDSANVDAMVEGTRVECIIGATRIRDFSIATEVLQGKVMTFVNQIAEIVHGVVDEFHGAANKNNGDTFLLIWRTSDLEWDAVSKLADMSMLAMSRVLGAVHRSPVLAAYRGHPGLQQRLGKNCRVTLSSGLHYGWAIEGAVGSEFKIDASYLSPNVSIAESVERATQIYGVSMLVAESVLAICTPDMASKCRLIDRVVITGSVRPMELHAIDLDYLSLAVEQPPSKQLHWNSRQRFKARQFLEAEKTEKWGDDVRMVNFFNEDPDIAAMRFRYTLEFIHVFNMGFQNYAQGEWAVAQRLLLRTRTMLGVQDGPSAALLRFMEQPYGFEAPDDWKGVRELGMALVG